MKHIHNKKIDDIEIRSLETSNKNRQENKTPKGISKTTIAVIIIIFIVVVASISVYFLFNSKEPNGSDGQNDKKSYFVSLDGTGNYTSIQKAIDSASNNDTIYVSNGTYFENIIISKPIEIIGEDKDTTIIYGNDSHDVIYISADHVKINGFTITNSSRNADGIRIRASYNIITDCNISSNKQYGLYLDANPATTNNIIKFNIFSNNNYGIYTQNAKSNNISSNTFTNNTLYALYLVTASDNNMISDNKFIGNNYSIRIKGSIKNTVIKNLIVNNNYGVYFCCGAKNNIAYNNIFINNTVWNADDSLGNTWDNGEVGNYWDDYTGIDANGDGIGDTPYLVGGDKGDNYPLMQPI
jgi:parallel beta-helix repeat protein